MADDADVSELIQSYKIGKVVSVEDGGSGKGKKPLKVCKVQISEDADASTIQVVTAATNVRADSRIVVAPVGSKVLSDDGDGIIDIKSSTVGGHMSEGMFCDSTMLGWSGGAKGVAVQVPSDLPLGSAPPATKPRPGGGGTSDSAGAANAQSASEPGLFEKKLTKEEKKKLAEERKKARKEKKAAAAASES